jgi:hypothetical protein
VDVVELAGGLEEDDGHRVLRIVGPAGESTTDHHEGRGPEGDGCP